MSRILRTRSQADLLRQAILTSVPDQPSQYDQVQPKFAYVPPSHTRALDPDAMVVSGIRGAGKSFWWHALQDPKLRGALIAQRGLKVTAGFGVRSDEAWPDKDEIRQMLAKGARPELIWKSVVVRHLAPPDDPSMTWSAWVDWVHAQPAMVGRRLRAADAGLTAQKVKHLVVFDALDRTADDADNRRDLLRGLLQLVLDLRAFRSLRAKLFVRPDMLDDPRVTSFPDASKVVASRVSLDWTPLDLYALLFRYLGNADDDEAAATFCRIADLTGAPTEAPSSKRPWEVPRRLRVFAVPQERVFVRLAGPWMGTNSRRGKTYTWVSNHLADAAGNVSPRSFLAAMRRAAEVAESSPEVGQTTPLHWKGLQEGVRKASEYRVIEIEEDLPWAHQAMEALDGLVVPCKRSEIEKRWKGALVKELVRTGVVSARDDGLNELVAQLRAAGILETRPDSRVNIPDVYRVGFGLRRKGGFRPKSTSGGR